MLAACSDKDIAPDSGGSVEQEGKGYIGVRIQMPTAPSTRAEFDPTKPGNDNFDDGVASEYKLDDAVLVLFQGANENNAQCIGAYELRRSQTHGSPNSQDQVTTQVTRVATVTGMTLSESDNLYALVIANGIANKLLTLPDLYADWMQVTTGTDGTSTTRGKTIKEFQETITEKQLYSLNGKDPGEGYASSIVMTNSPLAEKNSTNNEAKGGSNDPGTISGPLPVLVKLNNKVYETEAEAVEKPAGIIHVERAVGKVTCSDFKKETDVTVTVAGVEYKLVVDEIWWDMAQDMKKTYIVRNTNRVAVINQAFNPKPNGQQTDNMWLWNYKTSKPSEATFINPNGLFRMIGHTPINSEEVNSDGTKTAKTYYRPYFCQVPGYGKAVQITVTDEDGKPVVGEDGKETKRASTTKEDKAFYKTEMDAGDAVKWTKNGAFYPRENTFPVEFMKYANTTRIGFWVTFKFVGPDNKELNLGETKDFFTKGLDKKTIYLRDKEGQDPLTAAVIADLVKNEKIKEAVEAVMDKENAQGYDNLYLGDLLAFDYDEDKQANSGEICIKKIAFKNIESDEITDKYGTLFNGQPTLVGSGYSFEDDLERLNNLDQVFVYEGGKTFYEVRVKHFGDDLTPWVAGDQAATIDQSYGSANNASDFSKRNANYLGRYGIVRNNWYDLQIANITKLGDPQDPAKWDGSWPGKPDDNKDEYIAVILRVLSWAKRTQSVTF